MHTPQENTKNTKQLYGSFFVLSVFFCGFLAEVCDEVLAHLLELNAQRAEEEKLAGAAKPTTKGGGKRAGKVKGMEDMFEE
jgi:hypothetical protein